MCRTYRVDPHFKDMGEECLKDRSDDSVHLSLLDSLRPTISTELRSNPSSTRQYLFAHILLRKPCSIPSSRLFYHLDDVKVKGNGTFILGGTRILLLRDHRLHPMTLLLESLQSHLLLKFVKSSNLSKQKLTFTRSLSTVRDTYLSADACFIPILLPDFPRKHLSSPFRQLLPFSISSPLRPLFSDIPLNHPLSTLPFVNLVPLTAKRDFSLRNSKSDPLWCERSVLPKTQLSVGAYGDREETILSSAVCCRVVSLQSSLLSLHFERTSQPNFHGIICYD